MYVLCQGGEKQAAAGRRKSTRVMSTPTSQVGRQRGESEETICNLRAGHHAHHQTLPGEELGQDVGRLKVRFLYQQFVGI